MSLEHAILVSLGERSASGYDLARRFDTTATRTRTSLPSSLSSI